jgi:hypothetical protein
MKTGQARSCIPMPVMGGHRGRWPAMASYIDAL